jgi:hypothetical protein
MLMSLKLEIMIFVVLEVAGNMKVPIFIFCCIFLVGCSKPYTGAQLVGKYALNVGPGTDLLELHGDGTYIHSFQDPKGLKTMRNGKWEIDNIDAGPMVTLNDFQPIPGEQIRGEGFFLLNIKDHFGKIRLIANKDLNEFYEKKGEIEPTSQSKHQN